MRKKIWVRAMQVGKGASEYWLFGLSRLTCSASLAFDIARAFQALAQFLSSLTAL